MDTFTIEVLVRRVKLSMGGAVAGVLLLALAACSTLASSPRPAVPVTVGTTGPLFDGEFDNREQVLSAPTSGVPIPRVVVTLRSLNTRSNKNGNWLMWQTRMPGSVPDEAVWAMNVARADDGSAVATPYRALIAAPDTHDDFDPRQWTPLTACALRGSITSTGLNLTADAAACATIAPGVGAQAALLPLTMQRDGEWLRTRLYADQARGVQAHEEARRVRWFAGWAAINGGGPNAKADNQDWHMNRDLRLGSEGGRAKLTWRDGTPSGYSISLERATYSERNMQVLKLSVSEDSDGHVLAYAWASPDSTRIGLNLGWLQVGLQEGGGAQAPTSAAGMKP